MRILTLALVSLVACTPSVPTNPRAPTTPEPTAPTGGEPEPAPSTAPPATRSATEFAAEIERRAAVLAVERKAAEADRRAELEALLPAAAPALSSSWRLTFSSQSSMPVSRRTLVVTADGRVEETRIVVDRKKVVRRQLEPALLARFAAYAAQQGEQKLPATRDEQGVFRGEQVVYDAAEQSFTITDGQRTRVLRQGAVTTTQTAPFVAIEHAFAELLATAPPVL